MMTPSFGTIACHCTGKKSGRKSIPEGELDFYLDFVCHKPKLKWSSMKFDSRQQKATTSNSSILIARAININLPLLSGTPQSTTLDFPLSIPDTIPSPLHNLTPRDKRPSTRPALNRYRPFRTTSRSRTLIGIVSIPQPEPVPQTIVPIPITGHLQIFNSHPQLLHLLTLLTPTRVFVELTFVTVTIVTPELPQPPLESTFGDPASLADQ